MHNHWEPRAENYPASSKVQIMVHQRFALICGNVCRHHYQGIQSKETTLRAAEYRQMAGRAGRAGIDT